MKTNHLLTAGIVLLLAGCKKEELIPVIVNELEFVCPDGNPLLSFFEGYIDGKKFCYIDEVDNYEREISATAGFRTTGPTTSTNIDTSAVSNFRVWGNLGFIPKYVSNGDINGTPLPHLKHYVQIQTPASPINIPLSEIIKNNIIEPGDFPIRSDIVDEFEGFNIVFQFNDLEEGVSVIFEASGGNQDGSFLKITELNITELPGGRSYEVTFEFACNLYYYREPNNFYARLENGKMKLLFEV